MLKALMLTLVAAFSFSALAADVINNDNKAQHDPTLVVERTQMMQSLLNDLQKPNPPADAMQKLQNHLKAIQTEVRDLADQLNQCRAGKK